MEYVPSPSAARGMLAASPATFLLRALRVGLLPCTEWKRLACDSVDRAFDSCGNCLGLDESRRHLALGPLLCECQRECTVVRLTPENEAG